MTQGSEEYWYDFDGQRIAVVKRDANGTKTETIWFIGEVEAHYDQTDTHVLSYTHLALGTPLARVKRTPGDVVELEYQFHGLANHTLVAVGSTGTTNAAFSYSPFGEVLESIDAGGTSGTANHSRRFNDKYADYVSDNNYYGVRYYDKTLIAWTQSDPAYSFAPELARRSTPRRGNLYTFTLNNALRYLDPDGRDPGRAASVKMPESPQTLQQRDLQNRLAAEDWTIKFAKISQATPGLDIDTTGCSGGWSGRWCEGDDDDFGWDDFSAIVTTASGGQAVYNGLESFAASAWRASDAMHDGRTPSGGDSANIFLAIWGGALLEGIPKGGVAAEAVPKSAAADLAVGRTLGRAELQACAAGACPPIRVPSRGGRVPLCQDGGCSGSYGRVRGRATGMVDPYTGTLRCPDCMNARYGADWSRLLGPDNNGR